MKKKKRPWIKWCIFIVLLLCAMTYFSSQSGTTSGNLSLSITKKAIEIFNLNSTHTTSQYHHIIRKCAHFILFLSIGFCLTGILKYQKIFPTIPTALIISFFIAGSDEIHQLFVPGRGSQFSDVLLDTCGAFVGIMLMWISYKLQQKNQLKNRKEENSE